MVIDGGSTARLHSCPSAWHVLRTDPRLHVWGHCAEVPYLLHPTPQTNMLLTPYTFFNDANQMTPTSRRTQSNEAVEVNFF